MGNPYRGRVDIAGKSVHNNNNTVHDEHGHTGADYSSSVSIAALRITPLVLAYVSRKIASRSMGGMRNVAARLINGRRNGGGRAADRRSTASQVFREAREEKAGRKRTNVLPIQRSADLFLPPGNWHRVPIGSIDP